MSLLRTFVLLLSAAILASVVPGASADCVQWVVGPGQRSAGPNGTSHAAFQWDADGAGPNPAILVVGGSFSVAGTATARNIATWDGATWSTLGEGFNGAVRCLGLYNNQLVAGGSFTASGTTTCNGIARWTGTQWQPLGAGVNGSVHCMAEFAGRLYAGGAFSSAGGLGAYSIASWDGGVWRVLGSSPAGPGGPVGVWSGGNAGTVAAMALFNGNLIVGGQFDFAGNLAGTRSLVQWNGSAWVSLNAFPDAGGFPSVTSLGVTTFVAGQGENLFVGGSFSAVAGISAQNIARYNTLSGTWNAVAGGMQSTVLKMFVVQFGGLHSVTISRSSLNGQGGGTYRYTSLSGVWNLLSPAQGNFYALALSGNLLGGVNGTSELIGSNWMPLGPGVNGSIPRMHHIGSDLYASGPFTVVDQQIAGGAARFDGSQWHALGTGPGMVQVQSSVIFNNQFVVGGQITSGTTTTVRASRWDGATWITMGSIPGASFDLLRVIDGSLYAAADGMVYRWNGLGWQSLATTAVQLHEFGFAQTVTSLFSKSGILYAAAGSVLNQLTGNTWVDVAEQPPTLCDRYLNLNGQIVGAASSGGGPIYRWLEPGWETLLAPSTNSTVSALAEHDGTLHALVNNSLARFDGSQWTVLGIFTGGAATGIHFRNSEIIVSGNIGAVDNAVSPLWARRVYQPSADFNKSGSISVQDIFDFLAAYFAGDPCADFNGSGAITVQDIFDFLAAYFAG